MEMETLKGLITYVIVGDLSLAEKALAAERSWAEITASYHANPEASVVQNSRWVRVVSTIPNSSVNSVCCSRLVGDVQAEIEALIAPYQGKAGTVAWITGAATEPADLGEYLKQHGFEPRAIVECMVFDLTRHRSDMKPCADLSFPRVTNMEELTNWFSIQNEVFQGSGDDPLTRFMVQTYRALGFGSDAAMLHVTAVHNGERVGSASLFRGQETASIQNVAVKESARGKGIGTAMVHHLLDLAQQNGYRYVMLQAGKKALPLYQKVGFEACGQLTAYIRRFSGEHQT